MLWMATIQTSWGSHILGAQVNGRGCTCPSLLAFDGERVIIRKPAATADTAAPGRSASSSGGGISSSGRSGGGAAAADAAAAAAVVGRMVDADEEEEDELRAVAG
jgi:hypothetical protein